MGTPDNPTTADGRSLFHDITTLLPSMREKEYQKLRKEIQRYGLEEPLWRYQGQIIDGRLRYRACQELGIEPTYHEWDGQGSLLSFVLCLNLPRLSRSQRAMIAITIEEWLEKEAEAKELSVSQKEGESHVR